MACRGDQAPVALELYQTTHRSSPLHNCGVACGINLWKHSGIDTSEFRAHSTRGSSTSKAKASESCQEILTMANCKKESTFRRHHLRLLVIAQAPFKQLCSEKVSMDFKHTLLYLISVCS